MERLDCGHYPTRATATTPGYGKSSDGKTYCFDCCTARDLATIAAANPGDRLTFYVGHDGDRPSFIINWPGDVLMRNVLWGKRHRWSTERYYISAEDRQGRIWSGTGAPGMWANLRLTKRSVEYGPAALAKGDPRQWESWAKVPS